MSVTALKLVGEFIAGIIAGRGYWIIGWIAKNQVYIPGDEYRVARNSVYALTCVAAYRLVIDLAQGNPIEETVWKWAGSFLFGAGITIGYPKSRRRGAFMPPITKLPDEAP